MERTRAEWAREYSSQKEEGKWAFPTVSQTLKNYFEKGDYVLEAGCGDGGVCFALEVIGEKILGMDIVPEIIRKAHLTAKEKSSDVEFIVGDVTHLPLRGKSLDGLISLGVIEHFRKRDEVNLAFKETHRVLKPNGKALFTIPNLFVPARNNLSLLLSRGKFGLWHQFYTQNYLSEIVKANGAKLDADVVDLWLPVYFVIDGLLKKVGVGRSTRTKIYYAFVRLPQLKILKPVLGHIILKITA